MAATFVFPTTSTSEKRMSRRKQPPTLEPVPITLESLNATNDPRYPPFDMEDPFASLLELRRRCFSYGSYDLNYQLNNSGTPSADTAPFDIPPKAFPSRTSRRYTLTVDLPTSFYAFDAELEPKPTHVECKTGAPSERSLSFGTDDRSAALQALTKNSRDDRRGVRNAVPSEMSFDTAQRNNDSDGGSDHHRRYSHIASYFEGAATSQKTVRSSKSHYLLRKLSNMGSMQTPPLTPDVSGSSLDTMGRNSPSPQTSTFAAAEKEAALRMKRSPSPSAASLMRKLLPRRSTPDLVLKKKGFEPTAMGNKDLPPLPRSSTPLSNQRRQDSSAVPFPMSLPNKSDMSLTPTLHDMRPDPFRSISPLTIQANQPGAWTITGAELGTAMTPTPTSAKRNKFFSLGSRSVQSSRTDIREFGEKARSTSRLGLINVVPDDDMLPTHEQLKLATSLPVVSDSGARIPFGDLIESSQTLVVFIRHFRSTTSQDFIRSICTDVDVDALAKAGLKIVIIGLGSHTLINPYRHLTGARTLQIYTDPTLELHRALGLKTKSSTRVENSEQFLSDSATKISGIRKAMTRRLTLPLFERAGSSAQLGGEFIFTAGPICTYARRMTPISGCSRSHTPILSIVGLTGVQTPSEKRATRAVRRREKAMRSTDDRRDSMADEDAWMAARRRSLTRLRRKRQCRRVAGVEAATAFNYIGRLPPPSPSPQQQLQPEVKFAAVEEEDFEGDEETDLAC